MSGTRFASFFGRVGPRRATLSVAQRFFAGTTAPIGRPQQPEPCREELRGSSRSRSLVRGFVAMGFLVVCPHLFPIGPEKRPVPFVFLSPVRVDLTQQFNPWDPRGRYSLNRWKLSTGYRNVTLEHTNQAPQMLKGRQFQAVPAGYLLAEVDIKRPWGTLHGFRTTGYNSRMIQGRAARSFSGAWIEMPKSILGARVGGFYMRGAPAEELRGTADRSPAQRRSSLVGVTLARDLRKRYKLLMEWAQSLQEPGRSGQRNAATSGRGAFIKLSGRLLSTDSVFTYRSRGEGLVNPSAPQAGRSARLLQVDLLRAVKRHQVQYSSQFSPPQGSLTASSSLAASRHETVGWSYSPKTWPRVSASRSRSLYGGRERRESEENLRLSAGKSLKRLNLGLAWLRGTRTGDQSPRPLWERAGIAGSAAIEMGGNRQFVLRYEVERLASRSALHLLLTRFLQASTRLSFQEDRISFAPAVHYRQQQDIPGSRQMSHLHFALTTLLKLPRSFPGSDLLLIFSSDRRQVFGQPGQLSAGLTMQWVVKRI